MKQKNGFSLVELLIVIGIIAVLGGVMLTQFSGSTESALATSCLNNMRSLCNAALAEASQESYYPAAGPYQYLDIDTNSDTYNKTLWYQGWIGQAEGKAIVSCYYDDEGQKQHYAITNGTIWRAMSGKKDAYVCPSHTKHCKRGRHPTPAWSYAMNSFFGWDYGKSAGVESGRRWYGNGSFTFRYTSSPTSRKRPAEKVLLFAEIPFVENGIQTPELSTSAESENDMILQYGNDSSGVAKSNKSTDGGSGEAIGFNHKSGNDYSAHVAFADGHCVKLMMPRNGNEANLIELTTWLCTGQEYTFNGSRYEKVSE
jgi:prepilin-type N-terminal cleavage/methylation domain-containing protein/prepilin-type processing-associated H-X9-DG protein